MFGGNSNWRGPVWMPINFLIIEALQKFGHFFGDDFKMEFPTGSGQEMNLWDISLELEKRLIGIFQTGSKTNVEHSTVTLNSSKTTPCGAIYSLFNEYFHGCNGSGSRSKSSNRLDSNRCQNDDATSALATQQGKLTQRANLSYIN